MRGSVDRRRRNSVLAICGGGNAGHALAIVTSRNFNGDVVWLAGSEEKAAVLRQGVFSAGGLQSTGAIVGRASRIRAISANPAEIIPQADIVLIAVPAFAHAPLLAQISPYLKSDVLIGSLPARSGFEFEATHHIPGIAPEGGRILFGLQTLPWSTRVQKPGTLVNFGSIKSQILMATLPHLHAPDLALRLTQLFGTQIRATANFLNMTLGNPGQIIHPGLMYGVFGGWDGRPYTEAGVPHFYAHTSPEAGAFVEQLSADICRAARAVEAHSAGALDLSGVLSIHDWLRISYPTQTKDMSTVASCFCTGPLQMRKAPVVESAPGAFTPNYSYRYLSEDVPYGLVVSKAIAQLAEVSTPAIDVLLRWAERKLKKRFLVRGRLTGPDAHVLPIPQNYGIDTLDELIDWYVSDRVVAPAVTVSA